MSDAVRRTRAVAQLAMACEMTGTKLDDFAGWQLPAWFWVSESIDRPRLMFRVERSAIAGDTLGRRPGVATIELATDGSRRLRVTGRGDLAGDLELAGVSDRRGIAARLCPGGVSAGVETGGVLVELGPDRAGDLVDAAGLAAASGPQQRLIGGLHPIFAAAAPGIAVAGDESLAVEYRHVSLRSALRLLTDVSPLDGEEVGGRLGALAAVFDTDHAACLRIALRPSDPYGLALALGRS